jgi:uncharacterized protein YjbJ (UPF0337 family)
MKKSDRIAGNWKPLKGKVNAQWGKPADGGLDTTSDKRDQLLGWIQNSFGLSKDEAECQLRYWESRQRDLERQR